MSKNLTKTALKCLRGGGRKEAQMLISEGWYVSNMTNNSITWKKLGMTYTQLFVL